MKNISEFLVDIDPWTIYVSSKLKEDFKEQTGKTPVWPEYSDKETRKSIKERSRGGELTPTKEMLCYGYSMAVALAHEYVPDFHSTKIGRGFAFMEAVEALKGAGL